MRGVDFAELTVANGVRVWKCSIRVLDFAQYTSLKVGDGSQGQYWTHGWCREGSLMTAFPAMWRLGDDRNESVDG